MRSGLRDSTFKYVESMLFYYQDYPAWIKQREEELLHPHSPQDENIGGGRSSETSDPTSRQAVKLLLDKQLRALHTEHDAVKVVLDSVDEKTLEIIRLYYFTKPRTKTWDGIAQEVYLSRASCFNRRDAVVMAIANQLGMI